MSTLKDHCEGLEIQPEELDSYYFGCDPVRLFKHICDTLRKDPAH